MPEQDQTTWIHNRVKDARRHCERVWGRGWGMLSEDMRCAYVAREVLSVIAQQDDENNKWVRLANAGLQYEAL